MTNRYSYNTPRPALGFGLAGLLLLSPLSNLLASDHNTVGEVLAAMEKDAETAETKGQARGSAAAKDDSVAGLGILTDRLRAEAFLSRIPSHQRERLRQGYNAYQQWQADALAQKNLAHKVRRTEGKALYGELQNRYKTLLANRALSEATRDDIAYNRALLAVRHYRLMGGDTSLLEDALSYLKDVAAVSRLARADIPFLNARILDELGRGKAAAKLFHQIAAANGKPSLPKALATVYSGDSYFADNLYGRSITRYSQALALARRLQEGLGTPLPRDFMALVRYRLMWAQHRNVNSQAALKIAQELLAARHPLSRRSHQDKMDRDSLDILSESLLQDFAPARFVAAAERIGTQRNRIRLAQIVSDRLIAKNQLNKALPVLKWQYRADPLGRGLPLTMTRLAIVYRAQQADSLAQQTALDLLRIYNPDSLWRRRHQLSTLSPQDQLPVTRKLVASTLSGLYRTAMTQPGGMTQASALKSAAEFHRTWLAEFSLSQADKATALERLAKLHLAQGDTEGSTRYAQQLAALQQSPAASQLAVVIAFKRLQQGKGKPHDLAKALTAYQESAAYDPDDQVVGAIAGYYSEHGDSPRAERLWRSQLESGKSPYTRTAALRALLERKLQAQDYASTMRLIERYSFDPRHSITPTPELDRVYHRALIGEFRRLKAKGQLVKATHSLQSTLASYGTKMPRQQELRDLLYKSLAATSQWQGIIKLYESKEDKAPSHRNAVAHQSYALALERSMRYLSAARQYYATAGKYPKLAKKNGLLSKALALAEGEDAYSLAGDVAFAIAKAEPTRAVADRYYRLAAAHYAQDGNHQGIQTVLNSRLNKKKGQSPEATAQIYLALAQNAQNGERWRDAEKYAGKAIATIQKVPVEDYTYQYRKVLSGSYYLLAKRQAAAVRGRDAAPENIKRRLQADLKIIKTLKSYSQKVAEFGDPSDRLKMYSLLGVTSQTLAAQLADTRSILAKRAGTDEQINGVRRVQTKLNTLAQHYFGKADLTLGQIQTTEGSDSSKLRDADRTAATAIAQPSTSMFRPDSYAEGRQDGTTWVH